MLVLLAAFSVPASAQPGASPFGFHMGQQRSAMLPARPQGAPISWTYYYAVDAPDPDPEFDHYSITAPPDRGICEVSARSIARSADNTDAAFVRMVDKLTRIYGKPLRVDAVRPADNPAMSSLPTRSARWEVHSRGTRRSDVAAVRLWASYGGVSHLSIGFDFANGCPQSSNWRGAVITVRVTGVGPMRPDENCKEAKRSDCMMWTESSFAAIRILTGALAPEGEPFPTHFDYETPGTAEWKTGDTIVMLLAQREDGFLFMRDWSAPDKGRACLNSEQLEIERVKPPGQVTREGKDQCFRVPG